MALDAKLHWKALIKTKSHDFGHRKVGRISKLSTYWRQLLNKQMLKLIYEKKFKKRNLNLEINIFGQTISKFAKSDKQQLHNYVNIT